MSIYINEQNNINYPNRKNTLICADLILKDVRNGTAYVGAMGQMDYKIAVFQKEREKNFTVEFIQFHDGVGAIVEIYKDSYICADCIYAAAPLEYTIFSKNDNDNYYYERLINGAIIHSRTLDCFVTLYSNLYNVQCTDDETSTKNNHFTNVGSEWLISA